MGKICENIWIYMTWQNISTLLIWLCKSTYIISHKGIILKGTKWLKLDKTENHKCSWDMKQLELLYNACGSVS